MTKKQVLHSRQNRIICKSQDANLSLTSSKLTPVWLRLWNENQINTTESWQRHNSSLATDKLLLHPHSQKFENIIRSLQSNAKKMWQLYFFSLAIFFYLSLGKWRKKLEKFYNSTFYPTFMQASKQTNKKTPRNSITDNFLKLSAEGNTDKDCLLFRYTGHLGSWDTFLGFSHFQTCRLQSRFYAPSSKSPATADLLRCSSHQVWGTKPGRDLCWAERWHRGETHPSDHRQEFLHE